MLNRKNIHNSAILEPDLIKSKKKKWPTQRKNKSKPTLKET